MGFIICSFLLLTSSSILSFAHHESGDFRNEEFTSLGKKIHEGELKITPDSGVLLKVMTYNVLAQTQLETHSHIYKDHDNEALEWENRWPLIYNKFKDEDPHILCLQEVDPIHVSSHFAKLFELGYSWVFKKSSGSHEDGVAVFYKSDLLEVEAHSQVELNQGAEPLTADKVGVVVRLVVRNTTQRVVVATTHLVYNPRRSATRLAQAQVMLAEIDRLAFNRTAKTYYPIILTGDFNLQPYTGVYKFLTEGQLKYEGLSKQTLEPSQDVNSTLSKELLPCRLGVTDKSQHVDVLEARVRGEDASETRLHHSEFNINPNQSSSHCSNDSRFGSGTISHLFNFRSVYPHKQPENKIEASTNHNNQWITVDYIFYSNAKAATEVTHKELLELVSWERLLTRDELESQVRHLPNANHGSDHLPLTATFLLHLD